MTNLHIAATKSSPEIHFDAETHILEIRGESYPENVAEFYAPVLHWLEEYLSTSKQQKTTLNIEIRYFNSSSSKVLLDFFALCDEAAEHGKNISVNWIYEKNNLSALEAGEEFQEDMEVLHFNIIEKKNATI